jgi:hypothetical protein
MLISLLGGGGFAADNTLLTAQHMPQQQHQHQQQQVYVLEAEAIVYDIVVEEGKGARTVRSEYLQFSVMGLSSSTPYEFR